MVSVRKSNGGYLYADRAELVTCDMVANNGVVHAIDRVNLPLGEYNFSIKPIVPFLNNIISVYRELGSTRTHTTAWDQHCCF